MAYKLNKDKNTQILDNILKLSEMLKFDLYGIPKDEWKVIEDKFGYLLEI